MSERLTDEQLRELAAGEYGGSRQIAPVACELLALRASEAELGAAFVKLNDENTALRARVAQLEAALIEARIFLEGELEVREMAGEWPNSEYLDAPRRLIERLDAALKDAPQ